MSSFPFSLLPLFFVIIRIMLKTVNDMNISFLYQLYHFQFCDFIIMYLLLKMKIQIQKGKKANNFFLS